MNSSVATPTPSAKKGKGRAVQGPNRVDKNKDRDENPEARVDSTTDRSDQPPTTSGKGKGRAGQPTTRVEKGKGRADQAVARSNKGKGRANDTGSRKGDGPSTSSADRAHGEGAVKPQSTRTSSSPVPNDVRTLGTRTMLCILKSISSLGKPLRRRYRNALVVCIQVRPPSTALMGCWSLCQSR